MTGPTIQRAIISVSDKSGVLEFARALANWGVEIYSTRRAAILSTAGWPPMISPSTPVFRK